jgi:predicted amidohydrolase
MDDLRVSIVQSEIVWENKEKNLENYYTLINPLKKKSDLVVLPEMFTTGFSMHAAPLAEIDTENTIQTIQLWAKELDLAVAGSFLAKDNDNKLYNRGFFITPDKMPCFSDKRHLFRMSEEDVIFTQGKSISLIPYKEWNIRLIICYDLRFPVWIRNRMNEYDLLLCVANWPQSRSNAWNILLKARAIENLCYVCGVNRTGKDAAGILYQGESVLLDYKGTIILDAGKQQEVILTATLNKKDLYSFRNKFPAWKDADSFEWK